LPAGTSSPDNEAESGNAQRAAEVASPTGTKPPPAADLPSVAPPPRTPAAQEPASAPAGEQASAAGRTAPVLDDEVAPDDDTAPLPVISYDGPVIDPATSEQAERLASAGWLPGDAAPGARDQSDQAAAPRVRDPFEPLDRQAIPGLAELAEEQRRSASRTGSSPPAPGAAAPASDEQIRPSASAKPVAGTSASSPASAGNPQPPAPPGPPRPAGAAKMDQIKDLLLTAEALGDDTLGQHFDQVSDRQRQLIKEYFDQVVGRRSDSQAQS
jgi:hypothetical protein